MTTARIETIREQLEPVVAALGLELYDVELAGTGRASTLRVLVDREGGVDLEAVAAATRALSPILEAELSLAGPYTLEVSSPGIERSLRCPEHFRRAKGATVSIKARVADGSAPRVRGVLADADDTGCTVNVETGDPQRFSYDHVVQAHTVFEWGPAPKPGTQRKKVKENAAP